MLTWNDIIDKIKDELSYPFQALELSDDDIISYLKKNAIRKFSTYFPAKNRISLDTSNEDLRVPNRKGEYYIVDPDNRRVLTVVEIIPTGSTLFALGHPIVGVFDKNAIEQYALSTDSAMTTKLWSPYNYNHEFIAPNILRISPVNFTGLLTIEYEREIDIELTDILPDIEDYFVELCVGMAFMRIGRLRRRYNNIATPFGEIQLNAEEIYSEGQDRYNTAIENLKLGPVMNVTFDRG